MRAQHGTGARRLSRWIPAIAAPIAMGVAVVVVPMQANAAVDLPDLTPAELLEFAASSEVEALSGTIEQTSELGLPDLSGLSGAMGGGGAGDGDGPADGDEASASATDLDDLISLATGTHTARVYVDGHDARMQVLDRLAERDVYVSDDGAWVYDSREQAATHVTVDEASFDALEQELEAAHGADAEARADELREQYEAEAGEPMPTPEELLDRALAKLDETTEVSVGTDARVAGREVYELVLEPRDAETLVGEVTVAIDGETGVALAASVTARDAAEPAFSVAFTDVSFEAPEASVFDFTPPEGTEVTEHVVTAPTLAELEQRKAEAEAGATGEGMPQPVVHGEGWTTVVELPAGEGAAAGLDPEASAMLDALTQRVDGGRVLSTSLLNVLLTEDGRVLAGAVTVEHLVDVAGR